MFDDEVLAAAGLEVVDEPIVGGDGSQEERLLHAMGASFRKLQALHRARLDKAKSRMATVDKAEVDLKGRVAEAQTWFCQACEELKAAQGELAKREVELTMQRPTSRRPKRRRRTWPPRPRPLEPSTRPR